MSFLNEANFTAASLLIISEILRARNDIKLSLFPLFNLGGGNGVISAKTEGIKLDQAGSDDDEEERFVDVDKIVAEKVAQVTQKVQEKVHGEKYDPLKREPKYANA